MATSVLTEATGEGVSAAVTAGPPIPHPRSSPPRPRTQHPNDGVGLSLTHRGRGCAKQPLRRRLAPPPCP